VQFLIAKGVHVSPQDRWNGTPLADARRGNHAAVIKVLEECARHGRET
jgi:glutaminase